MATSFAEQLQARNAQDYADFLIPELKPSWDMLDMGCGQGEISVGLAPYVASVQAVDLADNFDQARQYLQNQGITNVTFSAGDAYSIEFEDETFDVCFCHSTLEALTQPELALQELYRVLKPGGLVAVASVEYSGLILYGDQADLLKKFYEIRQTLWRDVAQANPNMGRSLREKLSASGFRNIAVTTKSFSYGTPEHVREFGSARAKECDSKWFKSNALRLELTTEKELEEMVAAWLGWSQGAASYLSFAWCRALGKK